MRREIYDIIEELKSDKKTILLTTHYIEEAEKLCDRVAIVDRGKIIAEGTPRELKQRSGNTTRIEVRLSRPPQTGVLKTLDGVADAREFERRLRVCTPPGRRKRSCPWSSNLRPTAANCKASKCFRRP